MKVPMRPLTAIVAALLLSTSCASRVAIPRDGKVVFTEQGVASWYGPKFHGRKTSSGERYNMYGRSAAHRTIPLGTIARVTHAGNGRQVVVRINDRGPFVEGRIIDLSYGAARDLAMVREGVARVTVEVFGAPGRNPFTTPAIWHVQAGSFSDRKNAETLKRELGSRFGTISIVKFVNNRRTFYRVRAGSFPSEEDARAAAGKLRSAGYKAFVVTEK